jgi:PleD family two-component response regulator
VKTGDSSQFDARLRAVQDAVYSGEMEGLTVSAAFEADAADYASGAIDIAEFGQRVRARIGVA